MSIVKYHLRFLALVVVCFTLCLSVPLFAADTEFRPISTEQLKDLMDQKPSPLVLVDARTKAEYQEAHIGSAINIPDKDFDEYIKLLPADKHQLIVTYCNGIKCGKSKKMAAKAKALGYDNILIYLDGFPVWEEKGMPVIAGPEYARKIETTKLGAGELEKIVREKNPEYVLVDVRDELEFKEGHIPTAINIPAETFAAGSGILPKEKKIVVYCNSGGRGYMAYRKLMKLAYPHIYQATFSEWKEAKLPVETAGK